MSNEPRFFLRLRQVQQRVGLGRSTIYERIKTGEFPRPHHLGERAVGWLSSDIENWIEQHLQGGPGMTGPAH